MAQSRTEAQRLIDEGVVIVQGVLTPKPATMVGPSAGIEVSDDRHAWASRGGHKLAAALESFGIEVAGRRALDVGASTGGFTDVLLEHGAASVCAVDVGYGQLVWRLATDERVTVVDRTNFRHVDLAEVGAPFDVVVVDVSFISVGLLAAQLAASGHEATDYVVLVKPQFEVGKDQVGRGGIVSDPDLHRSAIESVGAALAGEGLKGRGLIASPIHGSKGNREFLLWARRDASGLASGAVEEVIGS